MKDMTKPTVVGDLPGIPGKAMGIEGMAAVADLNLLAATARGGDPTRIAKADVNIGIVVYDTTDCRKPTIAAKVDVFSDQAHMLEFWRDPNKPERVLTSLAYSNEADGVDMRVWDLTGCPKSCNPKFVGAWGLRAQLGIPQNVTTQYEGGTRTDAMRTHDQTWSLDGTRIHMGQQKYGYFQLDSSALAEGRACDPSPATAPIQPGHCLTVFPNFKPLASFGVENPTAHGVTAIPGRPYVMVNHEGYTCPYGGISFVYIGDTDQYNSLDKEHNQVVGNPGTGIESYRADLFPRRIGSFAVPENAIDRCPKPGDKIPDKTGPTGIFGSDVLREVHDVHYTIAFPSVAFATYYSGGLRAIDITNPFTPFELGYYFNKPPAEVVWCSPRAGACADAEVDAEGVPVRQRQLTPPGLEAYSEPITMNGYIVYVDGVAGVQVLKYTGPHADEIPQQGLCVAHHPGVVKPGYEPCPPFKTWSPAKK